VENSLWKRLWTYRKIDYVVMMMMMMMKMMMMMMEGQLLAYGGDEKYYEVKKRSSCSEEKFRNRWCFSCTFEIYAEMVPEHHI
jgi:hypothetical protein